MSNGKLLSITVERFKSFEGSTRVELAPLTVVLGRNNSGKSTLIQSLLLLKQTLADVRPEVMIRLEGMVEAFNLRELTFGWPAQAERVQGPTISLEWESHVDVRAALAEAKRPAAQNLANHSGVEWLKKPPDAFTMRTRLTLRTDEVAGIARVPTVKVESLSPPGATMEVITDGGKSRCRWNGRRASEIDVEMDHFIPYLRIDRGKLGPRAAERQWHNAYLILFAQPLRELTRLLGEMHYLGSTRQPPPSLFKAATTAPNEIGVSGELAAQLLHRRQQEVVHFLPVPQIDAAAGTVALAERVLARPLVSAVNEVLQALSVGVSVRVEEIREVGFRLLFGDASLLHVGRGLGYLLPLIELGLFADPLRFQASAEDLTLRDYEERCGSFTHIALEEPEAHLHPKVASRLAHWLVSLAMARRRIIVETHSDHLVRRLRGLVARSGKGSALEKWLLENVVILSVEQDGQGRSMVTSARLTSEGGLRDPWPADFMDEATDEESAIYYAKLDKAEQPADATPKVEMVEGPEPEPEQAP